MKTGTLLLAQFHTLEPIVSTVVCIAQIVEYTIKKVSDLPVPSRDVTNQTLPGRDKLFLARENLVNDIPAGDGKIGNLFLQCIFSLRTFNSK